MHVVRQFFGPAAHRITSSESSLPFYMLPVGSVVLRTESWKWCEKNSVPWPQCGIFSNPPDTGRRWWLLYFIWYSSVFLSVYMCPSPWPWVYIGHFILSTHSRRSYLKTVMPLKLPRQRIPAYFHNCFVSFSWQI